MKALISSNPLLKIALPTKCGNYHGNIYFCQGKSIHDKQMPGTNVVYGSNPYSNDSDICMAALHSGIISSQQGGYYKIILNQPNK